MVMRMNETAKRISQWRSGTIRGVAMVDLSHDGGERW